MNKLSKSRIISGLQFSKIYYPVDALGFRLGFVAKLFLLKDLIEKDFQISSRDSIKYLKPNLN